MDSLFIKDTIRQLKNGMQCYAFNMDQIKEISKKYKLKTGNGLEIRKEEYYYILKPSGKDIQYNF